MNLQISRNTDGTCCVVNGGFNGPNRAWVNVVLVDNIPTLGEAMTISNELRDGEMGCRIPDVC